MIFKDLKVEGRNILCIAEAATFPTVLNRLTYRDTLQRLIHRITLPHITEH